MKIGPSVRNRLQIRIYRPKIIHVLEAFDPDDPFAGEKIPMSSDAGRVAGVEGVDPKRNASLDGFLIRDAEEVVRLVSRDVGEKVPARVGRQDRALQCVGVGVGVNALE